MVKRPHRDLPKHLELEQGKPAMGSPPLRAPYSKRCSWDEPLSSGVEERGVPTTLTPHRAG
jgi:hypothetical protein